MIGLLRGASEALNGLAWASVLLLVAGIHNAWDLVVYMVWQKNETTQP